MTPVRADVPTSTDFYTSSASEWKNGFAVGAGVSLKWRRIRIEPEYRFTGIPNGAQTIHGTRVGDFLSPLIMDKTHDILFGIRF